MSARSRQGTEVSSQGVERMRKNKLRPVTVIVENMFDCKFNALCIVVTCAYKSHSLSR